MCKIWKF